jgi:hypothetical protein
MLVCHEVDNKRAVGKHPEDLTITSGKECRMKEVRIVRRIEPKAAQPLGGRVPRVGSTS